MTTTRATRQPIMVPNGLLPIFLALHPHPRRKGSTVPQLAPGHACNHLRYRSKMDSVIRQAFYITSSRQASIEKAAGSSSASCLDGK